MNQTPLYKREDVLRAMHGDADAFALLYRSTYEDKYHLALRYMKKPEEAEDVLQDAYLKAWNQMGSLRSEEGFSSWLGMIVSNTAKDALKKRKPMLFSELEEENEEGDDYLYDIPDESESSQPELSFLEKERTQLLKSLTDSLTAEQNMAITMFYVERNSIKEIARVMGCSENTVKSRLNYGRRNLKNKVEDLQKKGWSILGVSALTLFLRLSEQEVQAAPVPRIPDFSPKSSPAPLSAGKSLFFSGITGKIAGIAAAVVVIAGAALALRSLSGSSPSQNPEPTSVVTEETAADSQAEPASSVETEEPEETSAVTQTEQISSLESQEPEEASATQQTKLASSVETQESEGEYTESHTNPFSSNEAQETDSTSAAIGTELFPPEETQKPAETSEESAETISGTTQDETQDIWKKAYYDLSKSFDAGCFFELCYINEDDIPELAVLDTDLSVLLYTMADGEARKAFTQYSDGPVSGGLSYIPRENHICSYSFQRMTGRQYYSVYSLQPDGTAVPSDMPVYESIIDTDLYYRGLDPVSEEEFRKELRLDDLVNLYPQETDRAAFQKELAGE